MKTLGILGGMGPMATACFMERITAMTAADTDQEQIPGDCIQQYTDS